MSLEPKYTHASRFAQYLRRNGNKVINGSCKLSLTTSALCLLNTLFVEVLNKEWPGALNISAADAEDIAADITFLYDFMKRASFLKLFHCGQTLRGGVDLSQFANLTVLELRKMPTHLIIGFDCLSTQLKALFCSRSIYLLKEIFGSSLSAEPHAWPELKELNLSYNYLESLDESLKNVPNVEVIDLSHNHLRNIDEIQVLKNLSFVNLSYNELEHLPLFNIASCRSLNKLSLRNNHLEHLKGLDCLFNLEELDISYNLLSDYHVLSPLDKLKILRVLNLEGNPLYFHREHQVLVARCINSYALSRGFQLNGRILPPTQFMSCKLSEYQSVNHANGHQTSINTVVGDAQSLNSVPQASDFLTRSISEISERSSYEDNNASSVTSQSGAEQLAADARDAAKKNRRRKSKTGKKAKKTREVLIHEQHDVNPNASSLPVNIEETAVPSHVKAKQLIEARRLERGEDWLVPDNYYERLVFSNLQVPANTPMTSNISPRIISESDLISKINISLATQISHSPEAEKTALSSTPLVNGSSPLTAQAATSSEIVNQILSSSPIVKELKEVLSMKVESSSPKLDEQLQPENDDIEVLNSSCAEDCIEAHLQGSASKEDVSDCDIYGNNAVSFEDEDQLAELESEEESEDSIFFAEMKISLKEGFKKLEVSLTVGANYIKEKDAMSGKVMDRLDLNVLQYVTRVDNNEEGHKTSEVHLEFDTVKSSRQKRIYVFNDNESAKVFVKILQPFADAKTLKEVTLGALECIKCGSQFSKQVAIKVLIKTKRPVESSYGSTKEYPEEKDACPNCGNHILVEMESFPVPSAAIPPSVNIPSTKKEYNKSPDSASIGSGSPGQIFSSLFSSMKISPILKRKPGITTQESQEGRGESSSANENIGPQAQSSESNESTLRRNSSDVTIISNPSQSSIAVIPDPDINLNTIIERDSQSSLSPPISQDSAYYRAHNTSGSEELVENAGPGIQNVVHQKDNPCSANGADNDFFSLTESSANESASHFHANEILSSGSEQYRSPVRSAGSNNSKSGSPTETKELDDVSQLLNILGEKRTITYDAFSEIDHRLKLHLEIDVFGDDEQLEACLQTSIVPLSTGDEFSGLFALSTKKLYIVKFLPLYSPSHNQSEPIEKVIQVVHSSSLSQLKQVKVILGNQGLTIACGPSQVFTLVIRDADICNSFSSLLSDFLQEHHPDCAKVEFLSSADETIQLLKESMFTGSAESDEMPEILLHLFAFWWNSRAGEKNSSTPVCVIVTPEDVFISRIFYKKQDSSPDLGRLNVYHYSLVDHQKLSDLVALKLKKDLRSVEVSFLNETTVQQNCDSVFWTLNMETKSALFSFICALKNPWEEIFGVPLSLSCEQ